MSPLGLARTKASHFAAGYRVWKHSANPLLADTPDSLRKQVVEYGSYSRKHNFSVFRIPKSANSTLAKTLASHMGKDVSAGGRDPRGKKAKQVLGPFPTDTQFRSSFSFAFVREPASRVLSAWLDKIHRQSFRDRYGLHKPGDSQTPLEFHEFLDALDDRALYWNTHWAPQSAILPLKGQGYDFIGRVETMNRDMEYACNTVFGRFDRITTRKDGQTGAARKISDMIGDREHKLIHKLYEEDYDLFYSEMPPI